MKLFVSFILISILNISLFMFFNTQNAFADTTYYARIMDNATQFYSSPSEDSAMFTLPETYFVELLSSANDSFYYARYNDLYGYVKKTTIKPVKNIPQNPFLSNISFRIFIPSGANLRSTPENLGATNLVYSIPFLETNLLYYGIATGEEAISKKGTTWYYCKYYVNNLSYSGYVYSPLCDCLSAIVPNEEVLEFIEDELKFNDEVVQSGTNAMESMSQTSQIIIIIAVSLPCLLFIYLLFKPSRLAETTNSSNEKGSPRHKNKKKISRLKHSDYFEFDDDFN